MAVDIYSKTAWANNTSPSLSASNLNHMEDGIKKNNDAIISLQSIQVVCENYASEAETSKIASSNSASASLAEANRAKSIVDDAITSAVSASTSASLIAIQPSVDASEASAIASEASAIASALSASNAFVSESNADLSETACLNYKNIMDDAINANIPTFSFNPLNGHLEYTGGTINFSLNTEKHLLWEVQL